MDMNHDVVLGVREQWGQTSVSLSCVDRRQHVYIAGKSGTGKSTLLHNMIVQDIESGAGFAFIDPHGDKARELLDFIPKHRVKDVIYFDPSDTQRPIGFNLFANVPPNRRPLVASGVVAAFKGVFPEFFGPRMEYIFYAAVAALLECKNVSLLSLQRMLSDERYRTWVVKQVEDPLVRQFWEREFEPHDRKTKAEMVSPILNKVGPLLMSPQIRNILGQVQHRIDARFMMDSGRIFIANLSKGKIGEDKAHLLGSFLIAHFHLAAMSRADIPERNRRDFFLYVDEFQSFISDTFASLLSEARKYRLSLTVAHQYLAQLKPEIADAVVGNAGSIISFRVGHEDAEALEKAFNRFYPASAFTSLSNAEICVKMLSDGSDIDPFFARTCPPQGTRHGRADKIIKNSRQRYSRKRVVVEHKITSWLGQPGKRYNTFDR